MALVPSDYAWRKLMADTSQHQSHLWLQISVDYILIVKMLKYQDNVTRKEPRSVVVEFHCIPQMREEFASNDDFYHHVETKIVLEGSC
jgi:hypothetical protein